MVLQTQKTPNNRDGFDEISLPGWQFLSVEIGSGAGGAAWISCDFLARICLWNEPFGSSTDCLEFLEGGLGVEEDTEPAVNDILFVAGDEGDVLEALGSGFDQDVGYFRCLFPPACNILATRSFTEVVFFKNAH